MKQYSSEAVKQKVRNNEDNAGREPNATDNLVIPSNVIPSVVEGAVEGRQPTSAVLRTDNFFIMAIKSRSALKAPLMMNAEA